LSSSGTNVLHRLVAKIAEKAFVEDIFFDIGRVIVIENATSAQTNFF
jgi:hypothetical protein